MSSAQNSSVPLRAWREGRTESQPLTAFSPLLLLGCIRSRDLNESALPHRVARIDGHLFANLKTIGNLELDPVIAAWLNSPEVNAPDAGERRRVDFPSPGILLLRSQGLEHGQYGSTRSHYQRGIRHYKRWIASIRN